MRRILLAITLLATTPAFAQQQQSPSEFALQASTMVAQLGQLAEQQKKQIEVMQIQINKLQNQLDEAKKTTPDMK